MRKLWVVLVAVLVGVSPAWAERAEVHFINVGHGDAIYINLPGDVDVVIDAGWARYGPEIVEYLQQEGRVDDGIIELMVASHYHRDHYGGLPNVVEAFGVEAVLSPGSGTRDEFRTDVVDPVLEAGGEWFRVIGADPNVSVSHTWSFGNYTLVLLAPTADHRDANENSIVLRLEGPALSVMFTGDAGQRSEAALLEYHLDQGTDLTVDVLKVGHHGSYTSTSEAFVDAVAPDVAVISTDGSYGHPHAQTLETLAAADVDMYKTLVHGTVVIVTDGETYWVTPQRADVPPETCISYEEALDHLGETVWVTGPVASVARLNYNRIFINIPYAFPNQEFVVMIHEDRTPQFDEAFGEGFEDKLVGHTLCVYGTITEFRGEPQILPRYPDQLRSEALDTECPGFCLPGVPDCGVCLDALNAASYDDFLDVPGIGERLAEALVAHQPYEVDPCTLVNILNALEEIPYIGPARSEAITHRFCPWLWD